MGKNPTIIVYRATEEQLCELQKDKKSRIFIATLQNEEKEFTALEFFPSNTLNFSSYKLL